MIVDNIRGGWNVDRTTRPADAESGKCPRQCSVWSYICRKVIDNVSDDLIENLSPTFLFMESTAARRYSCGKKFAEYARFERPMQWISAVPTCLRTLRLLVRNDVGRIADARTRRAV